MAKEKTLAQLHADLTKVTAENTQLKRDNKVLEDTVEELNQKIDSMDVESKVGKDTLKHGKTLYMITANSFKMPGGRLITADELKKDKELQAKIIKGGFGILEEVTEA
jgi:vacuolar-type H+-ATPase subunit E/Vma4